MRLVVGVIVVLVILYIASACVWYQRLDDIDQTALKNTVLCLGNPAVTAGVNFRDVFEIPLRKIAHYTWESLSLPFRRTSYFSELSEGGFYGLECIRRGVDGPLNDKLHWANLFEKHSIPYPKTIAYTHGREVTYVNRWDSHSTYVSKPRFGMMGIGVHRILGANIPAELGKKNIIIQELLKDCRTDKVRSFRCVTLHDGSTFQIYEFTSPTGGLGSCRITGGTVTMCADKCPTEVAELTARLGAVHTAEYPEMFSIGWDVMMNCGKSYSAYALEGNLAHCAWFYPEAFNIKSINEYKRKFAAFLR